MYQAGRLIALCLMLWPAAVVRGDEKPAFVFPDSPPQAPPLQAGKMPPTSSQTLDNGMTVVVVPSDEIPYLSLEWYLLAGANLDPPDQAGLAGLAADLLRQGTETYTAEQLAAKLDFHAIGLSGGAVHDYSRVAAGCLSQYAELAMEMLAEVVRRPTFPAGEFRRKVKEAVSALSVRERDANYQADRHVRQIVYGSHAYARPSEGTMRSLRAIDVEDVIRFHKSHYMPNRSLLILSGAIEPDWAFELARRFFGDWEVGTPPAETPVEPPEAAATHIYVVHRPDSEQSKIRVGHLGIRRTSPDYVASRVFNQVFGGGFNSRLNKRIRIEEGLTYGARGSFTAEKGPGIFVASTFTRNEKTAETVKLVLEEITRIRQEPPTAEEISESVSYLIGQFGLSLETPTDVAGKVFDLSLYGLPGDYYEGYLSAVNAIKAEDVQSFAKQHVHADKLVIVVVGDAPLIQESVAEIAPVTILDESGS